MDQINQPNYVYGGGGYDQYETGYEEPVLMTGPGADFLSMQQQPGYRGRGKALATHDAMGRPVIWEGPPCARCGHTVIGKVFATLGKNYHPECFTCTFCYEPFKNGQFMQHEDDPYCEKCYTNLMVTRCHTCQMPITDTAIQASGRMYHTNHFVCSGCGCNLHGQDYKDGEEGDPYCTECAKGRARLIGYSSFSYQFLFFFPSKPPNSHSSSLLLQSYKLIIDSHQFKANCVYIFLWGSPSNYFLLFFINNFCIFFFFKFFGK